VSDARIDVARGAWPRLVVNRHAFEEQLKVCSAGQPQLHVADLYLAFACAEEDPEAIRALAGLVKAEVPRALSHLRQSSAFGDDVQQQLLTRLVMRSGNQPAKIRSYRGRGPLSAWLRSAALRTALNALESVRPEESVDQNVAAASSRAGDDPELAVMRRRFNGPLKRALESALRGLEPDDRSVLRFYFVDGLTVEQIAIIRGTHKSTVSRLITRTRKLLVGQVEELLIVKLGIKRDELSSMIRVVQGQLDVSLERALARTRDP
jgi:RNA polymerase sigma-70 factor (ECF subfamily)